MPSPEQGTAIAADAPKAPTVAEVATSADPGEAAEVAARNKEIQESKPSTSKVEGKEDGDPANNGETKPLSWISVELLDKDGKPVPNEPVVISFSDNTESGGLTGEDGKLKLSGVTPGSAKINFVAIDKREWKAK